MTRDATAMFEEYDVVRVVKLLVPDRDVIGTTGAPLPPQVGDTGTIVMAYTAQGPFEVECSDDDGYTVWLATFDAEELERWSARKRQ